MASSIQRNMRIQDQKRSGQRHEAKMIDENGDSEVFQLRDIGFEVHELG